MMGDPDVDVVYVATVPIHDISLTLSLRSRQESTFSLRNRWR